MKILFTGSSSFTGMWFIDALSKRGHEITATLLRPVSDYVGTRRQRVQEVLKKTKIVENCPFGSPLFFETIHSESHWDLLCHHAADVTNYKSADFNYIEATKKNTLNLNRVIEALQTQGCHKILLTGSVFEQREGLGSDELRAVSPYGLSKGLTADIFKYHCQINQCNLGKFVIPNPFGPYEEERFTSYLIKNWLKNTAAYVSYPDYIRDNIHVSLLALSYADFAEKLNHSYQQINPSQYTETQAEFTCRLANEMRNHLPYSCDYEIKKQIDFKEPMIRINSDKLDLKELQWDESLAWSSLANYYQNKI